MAKYTQWVTSVAGTAEPMRAVVTRVSQDFFKVMGIQPSLGRGITPDDARIGATPVAIVQLPAEVDQFRPNGDVGLAVAVAVAVIVIVIWALGRREPTASRNLIR
jgi:hypothetical protein